MPIYQTVIRDYRQFRNLDLDFRDPVTGLPLEKICFIGSNGTGKSTLLRIMAACADPQDIPRHRFWEARDTITQLQARAEQQPTATQMNSAIDQRTCPMPLLFCPPDADYAPAINFEAHAVLQNALGALKENWGGAGEMIHQGTSARFWTLLIAKIKERESLYLQFLERERASSKPMHEISSAFDAEHPKILERLADLWNRILERAGLEFDYEKASIPVQLTDTFNAYICLKGTKQQLPWSELSTGIRHFLFRLGHIYTYLFERAAEGGVLFVDEPEASLHPDFLYDLVAHYQEVAPGIQLFMATHSPIIAAQFRPEERFVLEFQPDGSVTAHRGISPEGDDPNDILKRDFKVRSLYGAKGLEMWERFQMLGRKIRREPDTRKRQPLMEEYLQIGQAYDFAHEDALSH